MISRSFLRGFGRGLVVPSLLFVPRHIARDQRFDASVERAWEDVAKTLRGAMSDEGAHIGKKTDHTGTKTKRTYPAAAE